MGENKLGYMDLRNGIEKGYILESNASQNIVTDYEKEYHNYEDLIEEYGVISSLLNTLENEEREEITKDNPFASLINSTGYYIDKNEHMIIENGLKKEKEFRQKTIRKGDMSCVELELWNEEESEMFHVGDIELLGELKCSEMVDDDDEYVKLKRELESKIRILEKSSQIEQLAAGLMFEPTDNSIRPSTAALIGGAVGGAGGALYGALKAQEENEKNQRYADNAKNMINNHRNTAQGCIQEAEELRYQLATLETPKIIKRKHIVVIGIKTFVGMIPLVLRSESDPSNMIDKETLFSDIHIIYEDNRISLDDFVKLLKEKKGQNFRNMVAKCFVETGTAIEEMAYTEEIMKKNNVSDDYERYIELEKQYIAEQEQANNDRKKYVLDESLMRTKQEYAQRSHGVYKKVSDMVYICFDGTAKINYAPYDSRLFQRLHMQRVEDDMKSWHNVTNVVSEYASVYAIDERGKVMGTRFIRKTDVNSSDYDVEWERDSIRAIEYAQKKISKWQNIVEVYRWSDTSIVGIDVQGKVYVECERPDSKETDENVLGNEINVHKIIREYNQEANNYNLILLYCDGSVKGASLPEEAKMVDLVKCDGHYIGLTREGKLVCNNQEGQFAGLKKYDNVIKISAHEDKLILLLCDGTVETFGTKVRKSDADISTWFNVVDVLATSDGFYGVREDGCVLTTTKNKNTKIWKNAVSINEKNSIIFVLNKEGYMYFEHDDKTYKFPEKIVDSVDEYVAQEIRKEKDKKERLARYQEQYKEWGEQVKEIKEKRNEKEKEEYKRIEKEQEASLIELRKWGHKENEQIYGEERELNQAIQKYQEELEELGALKFIQKWNLRKQIEEAKSLIDKCNEKKQDVQNTIAQKEKELEWATSEKMKAVPKKVIKALPMPKEPVLEMR